MSKKNNFSEVEIINFYCIIIQTQNFYLHIYVYVYCRKATQRIHPIIDEVNMGDNSEKHLNNQFLKNQDNPFVIKKKTSNKMQFFAKDKYQNAFLFSTFLIR